MTVYDFRKPQKGVSGQQTTIMGSDNNVELENRVSKLEDKLDTIITLLKQEANNDENRPKPISGNDSRI
tara:strand:+ start:76 stop:282 length:207 start_codon:yes stop_codon:yes gene_type:complete